MTSHFRFVILAAASIVGGGVLASSLSCNLDNDWMILGLVGFLYGGACYVLGRNDGWQRGHRAAFQEGSHPPAPND